MRTIAFASLAAFAGLLTSCSSTPTVWQRTADTSYTDGTKEENDDAPRIEKAFAALQLQSGDRFKGYELVRIIFNSPAQAELRIEKSSTLPPPTQPSEQMTDYLRGGPFSETLIATLQGDTWSVDPHPASTGVAGMKSG